MQLTDAKVVILGGSTGIGFATAKAASAEGARVTIAGRSPEKLKTQARRWPTRSRRRSWT